MHRFRHIKEPKDEVDSTKDEHKPKVETPSQVSSLRDVTLERFMMSMKCRIYKAQNSYPNYWPQNGAGERCHGI